jgi:hypothetical protein
MLKFIKENNISRLFWLPNIIGLFCLSLIVIMSIMGYINLLLNFILITIFFFLLGLSGVPMIIKKEYPNGYFHFSTKISEAAGWSIVVFGFVSSIFFLLYGVIGKFY